MIATEPSNGTKKACMTIIAIVGWFALACQFYLLLKKAQADNIPVVTAIINYFSFFTILSNLLVAMACTCPLIAPSSRAGKFFSRYTVQSGITLAIIIVGATYSIALRHIWKPEGWQKVADVLLHDIVPILYALFWFFFVPKGVLQWRDLPYWLIYPLVYLVYSLLRGAIINRYPYYFIDANAIGYPKALLNIGLVTVAFFLIGSLLVAINRLLARRLIKQL